MVRYSIFLWVGVCLSSTGQEMPLGNVSKLPATVNSGCEEIFPLVSSDGETLFFARMSCAGNKGGEFAGSDIWISRLDRKTGQWMKPSNEKNVFNDKGNGAVVGVAPDGKGIYRISTSPTRRIKGIYFSRYSGGSWTRPELVQVPFLESEEFFGAYVSPDFRVILLSMKAPGGAGEEDLYVTIKNVRGEWSRPRSLGQTINTIGFEISPFLSADKKRLFFASNGHRGFGSADIFYSDRMDDSWTKWTSPTNMGSKVNSRNFDAYFSVRDSLAYFSSNAEGQRSDLYQVRLIMPEDTIQQQVTRIVAEANSMLADLTDDTYDSLEVTPGSIFVNFAPNSIELSEAVVEQLDKALSVISRRKSSKVTLVAYTGDFQSAAEGNEIWYRRLEKIRNYLDEKSEPFLSISFEIRKQRSKDGSGGSRMVEVRYLQ